jgi:hypothetical protein
LSRATSYKRLARIFALGSPNGLTRGVHDRYAAKTIAFEGGMDFAPSGPNAELSYPQNLPPLPQIWIGYLLGFAAIVSEYFAVSQHPEIAEGKRVIAPLYLFLLIFVGIVYWLVCVHRLHVILKHVPGWKHPISPGRAVGYHFIPVFYLYWMFKWPLEIARFVNSRFSQPLMRPFMPGVMMLAAFLIGALLDPGLALILLFAAISYISARMRRALALQPPPSAPPPIA